MMWSKRAAGERFCRRSSNGNLRNTLCISRFSLWRAGAKDPPDAEVDHISAPIKKRINSKRPAPSPLTLNRLVDGLSARKILCVFLFISARVCPSRRTLMIVYHTLHKKYTEFFVNPGRTLIVKKYCRGDHRSPVDFAAVKSVAVRRNAVISLRKIRNPADFGGRSMIAPTLDKMTSQNRSQYIFHIKLLLYPFQNAIIWGTMDNNG